MASSSLKEKIFILIFVVTVTAAKYLPNENFSADDLRILEETLKQLNGPHTHNLNEAHDHDVHHHDQNEKLHSHAAHDQDDSAFIQTLNLIFKHNNINMPHCPSCKPDAAKQILRNGPPISRCIPCKSFPLLCDKQCMRTENEDEVSNIQIPDTFPLALNAKNQVNNAPNDKLDELEKMLVQLNQNPNLTQCKGTLCDVPKDNENRNDSQEDEIETFFNDLEDSLSNQGLRCDGLRCGCSLSDLNKCGCSRGRCGCSLRCGCGNNRCKNEDDAYDRASDNVVIRNLNNGQVQDYKINTIPKAYKLNDDVDAFIIDATDANELLLKLFGTNLNSKKKPNSPLIIDPMQSKKIFRRSSDSDVSYGLPFELTFDGLGLINN